MVSKKRPAASKRDNIQNLTREDGSTVNITLLDKKRTIHNKPACRSINQYVENGGNYDNRYDVTILVNGLPLVHVELKRRGVPIKEAFNQINRYQRDSFWAGSGLYEYVQISLSPTARIQNTTPTRPATAMLKKAPERPERAAKRQATALNLRPFGRMGKTASFPIWWTLPARFFARHTLLNILTKYCVFTSEDLLLVMRPYQIAATERICPALRYRPTTSRREHWRQAGTSGTQQAAAKR